MSWAALVVVTAVVSLAPRTARAETIEGIEGTYVFVGGARERDRAHAAVESVIEQMGAISRAFARNKLHAACPVPGRIDIRASGADAISVSLPPQPPRASRLDGTRATFQNSDGREVTMHRVVRGDTIIETVDAQRSSRRVIVYHFSPDRTRLTVRWRIENDRYLPAPITYTLSFRRQ